MSDIYNNPQPLSLEPVMMSDAPETISGGMEDMSERGTIRNLGAIASGLKERVNDLFLRGRIAYDIDPVGSAKRAAKAITVGLIVSPANEVFRYGTAGAAQAMTGNSLAGAGAIVAATALTEGVGAYAASDLMDSGSGKKAVEWLSDKTQKITRGKKLNPVVEAGVGYMGGSAVVLLAKQTEDPTRTREQNIKHGEFTTAWLSAVLGAQWILGANGIENPTPANVALGVAGTVGVIAGAKWAKDRHFTQSEANTTSEAFTYPNQQEMIMPLDKEV